MEYRLTKVVNDKKSYLWNTNWLIVSEGNNCIIGGIMLKGLPNKNGEVIIGYYTHPTYQGNGHMTETMTRIKGWLLSQPNVRYIIADTEKDNIASHRVLEKVGAEIYKETEELYYWRIF
ncbi:GNAT family N-acetyltransferase [Sporosarcina sp. FSL K6-3457]|uniref:GNAT family N-acetyltransferase n=1 Tax=Sporosarcina sp. FSL K6-3457 TaxID=2978204 RepID=UPI0030F8DA50